MSRQKRLTLSADPPNTLVVKISPSALYKVENISCGRMIDWSTLTMRAGGIRMNAEIREIEEHMLGGRKRATSWECALPGCLPLEPIFAKSWMSLDVAPSCTAHAAMRWMTGADR